MFTLSTKIRCASSKPFGISGHKNYTHLFCGKPWAPHMLFFDVPNFVLLGLREKKRLSNGMVLLCESTSKVETGQQSWSLLFHGTWYICRKRTFWLTFMGHVHIPYMDHMGLIQKRKTGYLEDMICRLFLFFKGVFVWGSTFVSGLVYKHRCCFLIIHVIWWNVRPWYLFPWIPPKKWRSFWAVPKWMNRNPPSH